MDFSIQIQAYQPKTPDETETKAALLKALAERGERLYTRESADLHLTASAMILDPSMEQALMVFHNIYQSYSWTGGHADGAQDLLATAIREAKEETGVTQIYPLSGGILSLDSLDVIPHQKHGRPVPAHKHFTVSYGLIAPLGQTLSVRPEENSAVTWLPADRLPDYCTEAHMWPLYAKLLRRMRALREEKKAALFRLPELLLPWYEKHARDLPWRKDRDPYHVWLSEIMLQQTRVEAVKAYYERFLAALPDIQALAEADESLLFKLWEGLGYYRRAKHLQEAARRIVENFDGQFPSTFHDIRALPGVGDYTAGAIASQCFDQPTPALDGNVLRVLARYMEDYRPLGQTAVKKELKKQLAPLYPAGRCGRFYAKPYGTGRHRLPAEWRAAMPRLPLAGPLRGLPTTDRIPPAGTCAQSGSEKRAAQRLFAPRGR